MSGTRPSSSEPDQFRETWAYPSEVLKTVSGAVRFDVRPIPGCYKSGRQRFEATFVSSDNKKVVGRREAMSLTSKRTGKQYYVCKRVDPSKAESALQALSSAGFGIDDVVPGN